MKLDKLVAYLDCLLEPAKFRDYCPNGLQVEGRAEVRRIVAGVTACQALLDAAVALEADAVLVHHGYFWRGEDGRITGMRKRRLATLLNNEMSLLAYHLPLDAHPTLGNNAQWAAALGWQALGRFGEQDIGWFGDLPQSKTLSMVVKDLEAALQRPPLVIGDDTRPIRRLAWCSGGAQGYFEQAIALGVDAFVSGEISEQTVHLARESGVAYLAAGHHATERFGVCALAKQLTDEFGLDCRYIDIDNPA